MSREHSKSDGINGCSVSLKFRPHPAAHHPDLCSSRYSLQSTSRNNARPRMPGVPETTPQGKGEMVSPSTATPHPSFGLSVEQQHQQQRNRQPKVSQLLFLDNRPLQGDRR